MIARLDRLGVAKDVALTASIIGREFSYELLHAVASVSQAALLEGLEQLVRSDLLGQRGTPPQSRYIFKHALIRDAAVLSILTHASASCTKASRRFSRIGFPKWPRPSRNCWLTTSLKPTWLTKRWGTGASCGAGG